MIKNKRKKEKKQKNKKKEKRKKKKNSMAAQIYIYIRNLKKSDHRLNNFAQSGRQTNKVEKKGWLVKETETANNRWEVPCALACMCGM